MSVKVEQITVPLVLGESPHWDAVQQAVFLVSINEGTIHKYVLATGEHTRTKLAEHVSFIVPVEGTTDQFVVGVKRKFLIVRWDGRNGSQAEIVRELFEVDISLPENLLNDGKADSRGRLYCGSKATSSKPERPEDDPLKLGKKMHVGTGSLFRIDGDKLTKLESATLSNGLAWDYKEKAMYFVDSFERKIRKYDYDETTGNISNMKHVFDLTSTDIPGFPDGITVDTDGNLWVAIFRGSCILKVDPGTGKVLQKINIPALQVSALTFGGPNLDILFVTSACLPFDKNQAPPCGAMFKVTGVGAKGHPNPNFRV